MKTNKYKDFQEIHEKKQEDAHKIVSLIHTLNYIDEALIEIQKKDWDATYRYSLLTCVGHILTQINKEDLQELLVFMKEKAELTLDREKRTQDA